MDENERKKYIKRANTKIQNKISPVKFELFDLNQARL